MTDEPTAPEAEAPAEIQDDAGPETEAQAPEATTAETDQPAETDDATGDEPEAEPESGDDAEKVEEPKRTRQSAKDRIKELTAKRYEAEAEARRLAETVERQAKRLALYDSQAPRLDDFDGDHDAYHAAIAAHQSGQYLKREREADVEDTRTSLNGKMQEARAAALELYNERAMEFAARAPDFVEVVSQSTAQLPNEGIDLVMQSEYGPQIAYHLARNPAEARRIAQSGSPQEMARLIGRLEGRLSQAPAKRTTQAPTPITAIAKGSGVTARFDPEKASMDEYVAWRQKQAGGG